MQPATTYKHAFQGLLHIGDNGAALHYLCRPRYVPAIHPAPDEDGVREDGVREDARPVACGSSFV
jgi:hypothetical protein